MKVLSLSLLVAVAFGYTAGSAAPGSATPFPPITCPGGEQCPSDPIGGQGKCCDHGAGGLGCCPIPDGICCNVTVPNGENECCAALGSTSNHNACGGANCYKTQKPIIPVTQSTQEPVTTTQKTQEPVTQKTQEEGKCEKLEKEKEKCDKKLQKEKEKCEEKKQKEKKKCEKKKQKDKGKCEKKLSEKNEKCDKKQQKEKEKCEKKLQKEKEKC